MSIIINLIDLLYWAFWILILARVILSFTQMSPYHPLRRMVYDLTEPILGPIRRFLPPMSGLDFSPLIALLLLEVLRRVLIEILL